MRTGQSVLTTATLTAAVALLASGISLAAVDLNGAWKVTAVTSPNDPFFPGLEISCTPMTFTQVGTSLTAVGSCDLVGALNLSGTVDPDTGAFTVSAAPAGICSSFALSATASADSRTFTGGGTCMFGMPGIPIIATVSGSRCGNGVVEPFEQCDDQGPGDCCNATTCQFESPGTGCLLDANECTDDVCDGSGVCQHPDNTAPCDDGNQCTTDDVCGGGTCNGTPKADGTACDDGNACTTTDQCETGTCVPGPPLVCAPPCATGVCEPAFGCIADVDPSCDDPTGLGGKLSLTNVANDPKDKLAWTWSKGPAIALADLGNPTVDTDYTVCLSDAGIADIGSGFHLVYRVLGAMSAPAGSKWLATTRGFKYLDKTGTPDGLSSIMLLSGPAGRGKIKLKGKGPNLDLLVPPLSHFGVGLVSSAPLVQLKTSNARCWDTPELVLRKLTDTKLLAKGSPSGAFVE